MPYKAKIYKDKLNLKQMLSNVMFVSEYLVYAGLWKHFQGSQGSS
jgi:hypothetical protein